MLTGVYLQVPGNVLALHHQVTTRTIQQDILSKMEHDPWLDMAGFPEMALGPGDSSNQNTVSEAGATAGSDAALDPLPDADSAPRRTG